MERVLADLGPDRGVPLSERWPKAEGIVAAKCRDHGPCEPLNVNGSLWCPKCLTDPHFILDGDTIVGPALTISLEQPVNFISINCTVGSATGPPAPGLECACDDPEHCEPFWCDACGRRAAGCAGDSFMCDDCDPDPCPECGRTDDHIHHTP